jgi:hypothetical protein
MRRSRCLIVACIDNGRQSRVEHRLPADRAADNRHAAVAA